MKPHQGEKQTGKASNIKLGKDSGRVKVFVRVRPPRPQETSRKEPIAVNVQELSSQIHVSDPKHSWEKTFNFDHVFPKESTNPEVCSTISRPLVNAALNGFNGTLMAYGQTGSGKTHTLMAPDGITAGVIERCFKRITQDERHDYKVTMSYLQIYQEKIYDLLNSTSKIELSLREHPVKGVYVENLSEFVVRSPSEVSSLLAVGKKRLIFAETKMNRNSSRSHSVCQLTIERTLNKNKLAETELNKAASGPAGRDLKEGQSIGGDTKTEVSENVSRDDVSDEGTATEDNALAKMVSFNDDVLIRGRIYLLIDRCDLAGSERLKKTHAEGERLSEAQHINSSLLELGNVIQALAEGKKTHVPFRNSTLTRLLQESLGGNCKTSLVVCVSPTMCDVSETKSALFFGSRAMKITNTAYINVEVDYKRLSEDLSKIVNMKEKDLEELKQSFENRIERIKHEAETTIANAKIEAEKVMASVKSLYENQESSLQSDIESLKSRLEEERVLNETQKGEITSVKHKLQEDMFRARSALLIDITSMQLFYALKEHSFNKVLLSPEGALNSRDVKDSPNESVAAKNKVLQNVDLLLELFKSYLNMMNAKSEEMFENCGRLHFLAESQDVMEEQKTLHKVEDFSLYLANKTDDDKVVASSRCNQGNEHRESHEECIPSNEERQCDIDQYSILRDKLITLKNSIDGEALNFLKKVFEFDDEEEQGSHPTNTTRREIYEKIQEFIEQRNSTLDFQKQTELQFQADTLALLDHCHSHVIIDKALQSALLVLENYVITRRCHGIQKQKDVLEDENEALRKQIHVLQGEVEKMKGTLSETSSRLCEVKKSKEHLEDDLSSVFQLYNMRNSECGNDREESVEDSILNFNKLQAEISTLVESNEKLTEELATKEQEKETLQCELTSVKQELQQAMEERIQRKQDVKSTQTEPVKEKEPPNPLQFFQDSKIQEILSSLHDGYSSSLEKAASALETNGLVDISSLRAVINKRLGEEWSVLLLENAKMKSELDNIRARIDEEKKGFVNELKALKMDGEEKGKSQFEQKSVPKDGVIPPDGADLSHHGSEQPALEIKIYDNNKVIAKLEMDNLELAKGLQYRHNSESSKSDLKDGMTEIYSETHSDNLPLTKGELEVIVKEKLHELPTTQNENKRLRCELESLRDKFISLERRYEESNKEQQFLEEKVECFEEEKRDLVKESELLKERCGKLEEHLIQFTAENNRLKEELDGLDCSLAEAQHEKESMEKQKIGLEEKLRQERVDSEREIALEREQKSIYQTKCQEKTLEIEKERRLMKIKENCLSKVEKELSESKESYKKLQECISKFEAEKDDMVKEINGLRRLQGLPAVKRTPNENVSQADGRTRELSGEKRAQIRRNNKLNSELTRAKEQLVRLKTELILSNMQTRNLGTQLSSLREDSTRLEAELSTVRMSPDDSRKRGNTFSYYDENVRLELELGESKERIIDLQEKLLTIYKEKFSLEEKIAVLEGQAKNSNQDNGSTPLKEVANEKKVVYEFINNDEKSCATQTPGGLHQEQGVNLPQIKVFEERIDLLEAEKAQLQRDLEITNEDKSRLEDIESIVQQLVKLDEDQKTLKSKLIGWAQNAREEQVTNGTFHDYIRTDSNLIDFTAENDSFKDEANTLKETVAELRSNLAALELKVAVKESLQQNTLDKKAMATLLVSVKQERAELQTALEDVLTEKKGLEDELEEVKREYTNLQREYTSMRITKGDLELEILSDLTQRSNEYKSEITDFAINDLLCYSNGSVEKPSQASKIYASAEDIAQPEKGRTINDTTDHCNHSDGSERRELSSKPKLSGKRPLPSPQNKVSKKRALPSEPNDGDTGVRSPRSNKDDSQTNDNDNDPQHTPITYDLITIDDVNDDIMHADIHHSGLVRETPKGQREKPEGMEQDESTCLKTEDADKDYNRDVILKDNIESKEQHSLNHDTAGSESIIAQSAEVLVKTAWSIKKLFTRQRSLSGPHQKLNALEEL